MTTDLPEPEALLPHRAPFLFVDEILELVPGTKAVARWTLTGDEAFFAGHFPGRPTLPGVLMLEALAQVGACGVLSSKAHSEMLPLFAGATKVRFRRQVVPGETLDMTVEMLRLGSRAGKGAGVASVNGEVAAEAEITFMLVAP